MQVFVKVAAAGGFSAAARELRLSQTMVTKHVAEIEQRLGVTLFHRSTRRLTLTEAGRHYLESCVRILAEIEHAETAAGAGRDEPRGLLRISAPVSFSVREIGPLLPEFLGRHPRVSVELGLNDRTVDLIAEGWDLAVRVGSLPDSSLVARKLARIRTVVCAAPSYLAARGTPRRIADLHGHNCLEYTLGQTIVSHRWPFGRKAEFAVQVGGNLRANSGDALLSAACAGLGLLYGPTFIVAAHLREGRLVPLQLDRAPIELGLYALYHPQRVVPAKVRAFIDLLLERFSPEPPWDRGLKL
jgi:DNA-binding transcriptional LysR family regulator